MGHTVERPVGRRLRSAKGYRSRARSVTRGRESPREADCAAASSVHGGRKRLILTMPLIQSLRLVSRDLCSKRVRARGLDRSTR